MLRGLYTGASGMLAHSRELDVISHNLANVNTVGFKRDEVIFKSFPEMLIRRMDDNGVFQLPIGSVDKRNIVGKLGTGVEVNEVFVDMDTQGSLKQTNNPLDLAIFGDGFFVVKKGDKEFYTRNGSFSIDKNNKLVTKKGDPVMGEKGEITLKNHNFYIDEQGYIFVRKEIAEMSNRPAQIDQDVNLDYVSIDKIKVVDFPYKNYLERLGDSLYKRTNESGEFYDVEKVKVKARFLEMANVNPVYEMVKMIEADRGFQASQKVVTTADQTLDKLINNMSRV